MPEDKSLISFLRDCNDVTKLVTGKSLVELGGRIKELFGVDVAQKVIKEKPAVPGSSYAVLGVRPDASMIVIKASYRAQIKGKSFDEIRDLREAYLKILAERGEG